MFDPVKLKELLSQKITSYHALVEVLKEAGVNFYETPGGRNFSVDNRCYNKQRWWMAREELRTTYGANRPIPPNLHNRLRLFFPYVSKLNPEHVGYTPSIEYGEQDRQRHCSIVTLARSHPELWCMTDSELAEMAQEYAAFTLAELTLLPPEFIPMVYTTEPASCMSLYDNNGRRRFTMGDGQHPSEAYDAPGFRMAIARDRHGNISQRSLVWENPNDPSDKRYVRVYGDGALEYLLQGAGYVKKGLIGTRLKAVQVQEHWHLLPYLDGGGTCFLVDDGTIEIADKALVNGVRGIGSSAGGYGNFTEKLKRADISFTDEDGVQRSLLIDKVYHVYIDNELRRYSKRPEDYKGLATYCPDTGPQIAGVYVVGDSPNVMSTVNGYLIASVDWLGANGYVNIDNYWVRAEDAELVGELWMRKRDVKLLIERVEFDEAGKPALTKRFVAAEEKLARGKYVAIAAHGNSELEPYSAVLVSKSIETVSLRGRRYVPGVHEQVVRLKSSGTYAHKTDARQRRIAGDYDWTSSSNYQLPESWTARQVEYIRREVSNLGVSAALSNRGVVWNEYNQAAYANGTMPALQKEFVRRVLAFQEEITAERAAAAEAVEQVEVTQHTVEGVYNYAG